MATENYRYYLDRWYIFVLFIGIAVYLAKYYFDELVVHEYAVSSTVLIRQSEGDASSNAMDAFSDLNLFQPVSKIEDEIEILKSDSLIYQALLRLRQGVRYYRDGREVADTDLAYRVEVDSLVPVTAGIPVQVSGDGAGRFYLSSPGWQERTEARAGEWVTHPAGRIRVVEDTAGTAPLSGLTFYVQDLGDLTQTYKDQISVNQVNLNSNAVSIWLKDALPQRGVAMINHILDAYASEMQSDKDRLAVNTIRLIDERLDVLTRELNTVEGDVESYKRRNELTDVTSEAEIFLQRANEYGKQSGDIALRIEVLNTIEEYLQGAPEDFRAVPSSLNIADPTLSELIAQYNQLQLQRQQLLDRSTEQNPLVVNQGRQLATLRTSILESLRQVRDGLQITLNGLERNSRQFERQIARVPAMERDLIEIKRDQTIKNDLYLYLLKKREESVLSLAAGVPAIRVISPPRPSPEPIDSNQSLVYLAAILAGIVLPAGLLGGLKNLFRRVHTQRTIEEHTEVPVVGRIGHWRGGAVTPAELEKRAAWRESFLMLAHNLEFRFGEEQRVLLVTSAKAGEGKTFVSEHLGSSLASLGHRVVIVSLDLRKPGAGGGERGITDYLAAPARTEAAQLTRPTDFDGLHRLSAGTVSGDPARLLREGQLGGLVRKLRAAYDYVILDCAAVGQYSDALALAKLADATLFVVRRRATRIGDLSVIRSVDEKKKLPHPVIVFNDCRQAAGGRADW